MKLSSKIVTFKTAHGDAGGFRNRSIAGILNLGTVTF